MARAAPPAPTLFAGERRLGGALAALAGTFSRLQRIPLPASCVPMAAVSLVAGLAHRAGPSYDSTYLTMIHPAERLRVDYERFDAAQPPERATQRGDPPARRDGALVDAGIERRPPQRDAPRSRRCRRCRKSSDPASIFAEVAPRAGRQRPARGLRSGRCRGHRRLHLRAVGRQHGDRRATFTTASRAYPPRRLLPLSRQLRRSTGSRARRNSRRFSPGISAGIPDVTAELSGVTVLWANMDNAMSARPDRQRRGRWRLRASSPSSSRCADWTARGACAMFVNVLPVAVIGAVLGATGQPIDMATVFIMGISLGVAVDDTSFFIHGYLGRRRVRRSRRPGGGAPPHRALDDRDLRRHRPRLQRAAPAVVVHSHAHLRRTSRLLGLVLAMVCDVLGPPLLLLRGLSRIDIEGHLIIAKPCLADAVLAS